MLVLGTDNTSLSYFIILNNMVRFLYPLPWTTWRAFQPLSAPACNLLEQSIIMSKKWSWCVSQCEAVPLIRREGFSEGLHWHQQRHNHKCPQLFCECHNMDTKVCTCIQQNEKPSLNSRNSISGVHVKIPHVTFV